MRTFFRCAAVPVLGVLLLSGCEIPGFRSDEAIQRDVDATEARLEGRLNNYIGASERTLVTRLGTPAESYDLADGTRIVSYYDNESYHISTTGRTYLNECNIHFDIGEDGNVQKWEYDSLVFCDVLFSSRL